jgi:ribosomal protein S27E
MLNNEDALHRLINSSPSPYSTAQENFSLDIRRREAMREVRNNSKRSNRGKFLRSVAEELVEKNAEELVEKIEKETKKSERGKSSDLYKKSCPFCGNIQYVETRPDPTCEKCEKLARVVAVSDNEMGNEVLK